VKDARFEWDAAKDRENQAKHGVSSAAAQWAFPDPRRVIAEDTRHGGSEKQFFCIGRVGGHPEGWFHGVCGLYTHPRCGLLTRGKQIYEQDNQIHR
jgi:hypothetical protein